MLMAASTQTTTHAAMAISTEERAFFIALGGRIAALRKTNGITQVQLAEVLGVSQQTVQAYEVGRRRIQVAALPTVAKTLNVSLEVLFGEAKATSRNRRGPVPQWQPQLERIAQLPRARQRFVMDMLDAALAQQGH